MVLTSMITAIIIYLFSINFNNFYKDEAMVADKTPNFVPTEFDFLRPCHFNADVIQLEEIRTCNAKVVGARPTIGSNLQHWLVA